MYCPNCRTQNGETSRFCFKCGSALPSQTVSHAPPPPSRGAPAAASSSLASSVAGAASAIGIQKLVLILIVIVVVAGVALVAVPRNPAEKVVEDMYNALTRGDMNAYMDTILPENRRMPNPWGALGAMSVSAGPVGFDIGKLIQMAIRDLRVSTVRASGDYALVKAEGYLRLPALSIEVHFCDEHDVRRRDGHWYVDVFASERQARLQEYQRQLLADLQTMPSSSSGDPFSDLLGHSPARNWNGPLTSASINDCI